MEVIATKLGEQKLCFEGFMYTKKNETTTTDLVQQTPSSVRLQSFFQKYICG
jgi:hypothetical protein